MCRLPSDLSDCAWSMCVRQCFMHVYKIHMPDRGSDKNIWLCFRRVYLAVFQSCSSLYLCFMHEYLTVVTFRRVGLCLCFRHLYLFQACLPISGMCVCLWSGIASDCVSGMCVSDRVLDIIMCVTVWHCTSGIYICFRQLCLTMFQAFVSDCVSDRVSGMCICLCVGICLWPYLTVFHTCVSGCVSSMYIWLCFRHMYLYIWLCFRHMYLTVCQACVSDCVSGMCIWVCFSHAYLTVFQPCVSDCVSALCIWLCFRHAQFRST